MGVLTFSRQQKNNDNEDNIESIFGSFAGEKFDENGVVVSCPLIISALRRKFAFRKNYYLAVKSVCILFTIIKIVNIKFIVKNMIKGESK